MARKIAEFSEDKQRARLYTTYIESSRWADVEDALLTLARRAGVTVLIDHIDRGWLRKRVYFRTDWSAVESQEEFRRLLVEMARLNP